MDPLVHTNQIEAAPVLLMSHIGADHGADSG